MTLLAVRPHPATAMRDFSERWALAEPSVAAFVWSLVPNRHDADDLVQRAAQALLSRAHEYDQNRSFTAWAIGAARIEVLRFRQERGRDRHVFDEAAIDALATAHEEHAVELAEARQAVADCFDRLTQRLSEVIRLHLVDGLGVAEVASRLQMSPGAVSVSLHRARGAVRECLERRLFGRGETR